MTDTSLHTLYRPKTFDEVIGHKEVIQSLKLIVKSNRAKTFLFTGPSGCGKTTLARILASAFAKGEGTQANIIETDAATHTGVESVRGLTASANFRAIGSSPIKAYIIDEAHRLSGAAWTALLKAIEEPPIHVYWMFCTTEVVKIPKTIMTRSLRIDLKGLTEDDIQKVLVKVVKAEKFDIDKDIIQAIAENSDGSPRQALVYLEACHFAESVNEALKIMRTAGQSKEVIDLCRFLIKGKALTWREAMRFVAPLLTTMDAESVRIVICAYFSKALVGTKDDNSALRLLSVLECFSTSYIGSDKEAPLLLSIGQAINLGD